jgi:tetratricopeptide (TPR) repeat protein
MGGIGYINFHHADSARNNVLISTHILEFSRVNGVKKLFFASSACVYPQGLQSEPDVTSLREEDADPYDPDEGYGWEKLFTEKLCEYYAVDYGLETRVALDDFSTAIKLNVESSDAYKFRGSLLIETEDYTSALIDLNHAIEISPSDDDAFRKRANAYISLGQTVKALADLDKSIELKNAYPDYYFRRGTLRYESAQYLDALENFTNSIDLAFRYADSDPRFITTYIKRSETFLRLAKPEDAILDTESTIRLSNAYWTLPEWENLYPAIDLQISEAHRLASDAYTALGQLKNAKQAYERTSKIP